jgi:predicted transcriptional regulator
MEMSSKISKCMKKKTFVTHPEDTVKSAVSLMAKKNIGCIMVVDKNKPVGIVTERDILKKIVYPSRQPDGIKVKDVMTKNIISMSSDKSVQEAVDLLNKKKIKKLPVIEKGKLKGIVTMTDLLKSIRDLESQEFVQLRKTVKDLHLTKIKLQSRIVDLEDRINKSPG